MKTGGEGEMLSPASGRLEPPGAGRGGQGPLLDASRAGGGPAGTSAWAPGLGSGARLTFRCGLGNERNPERPGLRPEGLLM